MALRVGLNLLHLVPGETGGAELYARRLIPALLASGRLQLTVFAASETADALAGEPWASEAEIVPLAVDPRSRPRLVAAEQMLLPRASKRAGVELLHNLSTTAPAFPGVPQVTTILDLIYRRFPETHAGFRAWGLRLLVPVAARRSRRILTLSEAAKDDIVRFLGVPAERVDVTYLGPGIGDDVIPAPPGELALGDDPLVLTVSAKRPHKNLERLIDAVGRLERNVTLVAPGYATPFEDALRRHAEAVAPGRVRFLGWTDERTLAGLYEAAECFVFPSLAEGFGLPVLEALRRGLPVACSNATSLPEVGGDAVLYFDPADTGAIAEAIDRLLTDRELRERLRAAGPLQAAKFSWKATAEATIASYELVTRRS